MSKKLELSLFGLRGLFVLQQDGTVKRAIITSEGVKMSK